MPSQPRKQHDIKEFLPGADGVELTLEELERKVQEVSVKLQQHWLGSSRQWVASVLAAQTVARGHGHKHK